MFLRSWTLCLALHWFQSEDWSPWSAHLSFGHFLVAASQSRQNSQVLWNQWLFISSNWMGWPNSWWAGFTWAPLPAVFSSPKTELEVLTWPVLHVWLCSCLSPELLGSLSHGTFSFHGSTAFLAGQFGDRIPEDWTWEWEGALRALCWSPHGASFPRQ